MSEVPTNYEEAKVLNAECDSDMNFIKNNLTGDEWKAAIAVLREKREVAKKALRQYAPFNKPCEAPGFTVKKTPKGKKVHTEIFLGTDDEPFTKTGKDYGAVVICQDMHDGEWFVYAWSGSMDLALKRMKTEDKNARKKNSPYVNWTVLDLENCVSEQMEV